MVMRMMRGKECIVIDGWNEIYDKLEEERCRRWIMKKTYHILKGKKK